MTIFNVILVGLYSFLLLTLTFLTIKKKFSLSIRSTLMLGVILRLAIALSFIPLVHYDTISYKLIGTLTLQGKTIYPAYAYYHYPYFPGFIYIEALALFFAKFGFPSMLFLKLFFNLFDVANIALLYLLSRKNTQTALLYAVNPAMILLSAAHGQLEAIPLFFSLFALYLYQQKKEFLASFALGFAILAKVWPLLFLPFFLKYTKKRYHYVLSLAVPVLAVLLYAVLFHTPILTILHPPFSYRGSYGAWGISTVVHLLLPQDTGNNNELYKLTTNVTIILLILCLFLRKKTNLLHELFLFLLLFGAFVLSGANPVWLIPFLLLIRPPKWIYWLFLVNVLMILAVTGEVVYILTKSLNSLFINLSLGMAIILWLVNLLMILDIRKDKTETSLELFSSPF